jgi:hypothetical protein
MVLNVNSLQRIVNTGRYTINEENKKREINGLIEATKKFSNTPLLITYDQEIEIYKNKFTNNVMSSVLNEKSFEETKALLERIGFTNIQQYPNPYFGQCYSLTAIKTTHY